MREKSFQIRLTPRLALCADMCPKGARLIDVGCDHGYLAIELVRRGVVDHAMACDLRAGPLQNARENVALAGLTDRFDFLQTDGLDGVAHEPGDVVTVCGMGGDNVSDILRRAPWTMDAQVVAQPMTKQERLRRWLADHGYNIAEERLVYEDRRLYCAMRIVPGAYEGEDHMVFSRAMERDPLFPDYLRMFIRKYRKRARSGRPEEAAVLRALEEREKCL
ncbi:MAG: SAM-dependent methyltransferase [Ruminococcaceae bacterium]|jgi:tRNA (adenine22-N1)-methyltransferase|nr:SAM-dependent methyltransferase [Oscillospiraceae bacterium]